MPLMDSKRPRSENFTLKDKELLLEYVIERKDIVENKKTGAVAARAKERAWQEIANNYNALSAYPRTPSTLKICWENMKRKCRKAYASEKTIGDKKQSVIQNDPVLDRVKDILSLDDSHSPRSSSALYNGGSDSHNISSETKEEPLSDSEDPKADNSWSEYSPLKLKRPIADVLKSIERRISLQSSKSSPYIQTLTSETSESGTEDLDEPDAFLQSSNTRDLSPVKKRRTIGESSNTVVPYVQRLTTEPTSEGETQVPKGLKTIQSQHHEDSLTSRTDSNRNNFQRQLHRQPHQTINIADMLAETKVELAKLAKEHAISDEKRKSELHELQTEEIKLKIIEGKRRIALYELQAQETELKIEVLKSKLEKEISD